MTPKNATKVTPEEDSLVHISQVIFTLPHCIKFLGFSLIQSLYVLVLFLYV